MKMIRAAVVVQVARVAPERGSCEFEVGSRPLFRFEVEIRVGDDQGPAGLAGGDGAEAEHVTATAQVADLIIIEQAAAVGGGQDLEGESGQITVGSDQQPPATAEGRRQLVE